MQGVDPQQKAEIIDHIYDVALDPARFEQLLDVWERRIGPLRHQTGEGEQADLLASDPDIVQHASRASEFLSRMREPDEPSWHIKLATEIAAAFCTTPNGLILEANHAAELLFGIEIGKDLQCLKLTFDEARQLTDAIRFAATKNGRSSLLRFGSGDSDRAVVFHVAPVHDAAGQALAFVRTSELGWPENLTALMQDAFKLTDAELEIVRGLVEGKSIKVICTERKRSMETVRTQIRSILAKTETRSQTELIRITLSLMDVVGQSENEAGARIATGRKLMPIPFQTMIQPGNRRYDWIEFGKTNGRPCVFLPIDYGLIRWPASAEKEAVRRGIRVIVPVRAGFGHSGQLPPRIDYAGETAADIARLLDHLGVRKAAVVPLGADVRYAMRLAIARPELVSGIVACSGTLPISTPAQYDRMGKWHKFILANARYAPLILPFLVRAGFSLARRIGKEQFLNSVNAGSAADIRTFADPEVREAMILGSEVCLSDWHIAYEAFSRECIDSETDWSEIVRKCPAPVRMLQGGQDPQSPKATIEELAPDYPNLDITIIDDAGQLLFFQEWPRVLDELERYLPA
jgi:pimeloyl-ACP methyl ester carboxylesterase/DNA-binding CsgD family transcriptional regulator